MSRGPASWLALAATAAVLSACGNDDEGTIPPQAADGLRAELEQVESFRDSGDCDNAAAAAQRFQDQVNLLPEDVGTELKQALREGGVQLEQLTQDEQQCGGTTGATGVADQQATDETAPEDTAAPPPEDTGQPEPDQPQDQGGGDEGGDSGGGGGGPGGDNGSGGIGSGKARG